MSVIIGYQDIWEKSLENLLINKFKRKRKITCHYRKTWQKYFNHAYNIRLLPTFKCWCKKTLASRSIIKENMILLAKYCFGILKVSFKSNYKSIWFLRLWLRHSLIVVFWNGIFKIAITHLINLVPNLVLLDYGKITSPLSESVKILGISDIKVSKCKCKDTLFKARSNTLGT